MARRALGWPPEDDGLVLIRGVEYAEANAQLHMDGFDDLPKAGRDRINYAETPETGALPTRQLVEGCRQRAIDPARQVAHKLDKT
jgi:hypothetical protein